MPGVSLPSAPDYPWFPPSPSTRGTAVLVAGFPAGAFQANCFVLAAEAGSPCIVVDPGQDAEEPLQELLREHRLDPVAVLLTHGHFDHVFSAVSYTHLTLPTNREV